MLIIVGLIIVLGSVVGGYLMAGGNLLVLNQPSEFIVIGGAAIGSLVISTPAAVLKAIVAQIKSVMGSGFTKGDYVDLLSLLYLVFKQVQQSGVMSLEAHFEDPSKSPILSRYPKFLARHDAVDFLADSAKVIIVGGIAAHDLEALMDEDLKVHHEEAMRPSVVLAKIGDALPGLGIVAAVLGVVITMGHIDGPVEEIGHHVGAALIGTFLGILMSYGIVQPVAQSLEQRVGDDQYYCLSIKAGLLAVYKGNPPAIAVEFARRVLPHTVRPSFNETEQFCRAATKAPDKSSEAAAA
ncbi:MAG TPA: flagellar motor stator protein MotA [Vicinamibacterales bacterium]|nr:flagellar motor stator protein MotA [Vicinamibacterales bacterium]